MIKALIKRINQGIFWCKAQLNERQFLLLSSILVGLSSGLAIVLLKSFAHLVYHFAIHLHERLGWSILSVFLPIIGLVSTVFIVQRVLKGKIEKGTWRIITAITKRNSLIPRKQMYAQIITSSVTVGFGGSAGLESPVTITGAAFGSNYGKTFRLSKKSRTLLLACGVASGIGAAFNAPITGVLFTMEVLLSDVGITAFIPLMIAAVSGSLLSSSLLGTTILLNFKHLAKFEIAHVPFYILLGLICACVSYYHKKMYHSIENYFEEKKWNPYTKALFGAFLLSVLILLFPPLFGEGYESIKTLLNGSPQQMLENTLFKNIDSPWFLYLFLALIVFAKAIATGITIGAGGNGGNFAPALFIGSFSGYVFAYFTNILGFFHKLPIGNFTMIGMAGTVSGLFHAPLTAIFLIAEITGGYELMLPLMIVSSVSFALSKRLHPESMDGIKLSEAGHLVRANKDKHTLSSISLESIIEPINFQVNENNRIYELLDFLKEKDQLLIPVLSEKGNTLGCVYLENLNYLLTFFRENPNEFISSVTEPLTVFIEESDKVEDILAKMERTDHETLPVLRDDIIIGYCRKNSILEAYRKQIIEGIIE